MAPQPSREIRLEVGGKRILLCHGSPRSTTEYLFENRSDGFLKQFTGGGKDDAKADVIVFGHTHVPYHRVVEGFISSTQEVSGVPKTVIHVRGTAVLTLEGDTISTEQVRLPYEVEVTCSRLTEAVYRPTSPITCELGGA